jgi:uncharacterized protein YbjT (DUF2867 family)
MKVILFGASGMVGQGVLREFLLDPGVEAVLAVGRGPLGQSHAKLRELSHRDFTDFSTVAADLTGYDAAFFCLGVSSVGMKEADYRHITYDFTLAAAGVLARQNPGMTFIYVSGTSTDSTEKGRSMWARVKGQTENALLRLPFKAAYMFRPGAILAMHGIRPRSRFYRAAYVVAAPILPVMKALFPRYVITTEQVGRAMLAAARGGADKSLLENRDIGALAARAAAPASPS